MKYLKIFIIAILIFFSANGYAFRHRTVRHRHNGIRHYCDRIRHRLTLKSPDLNWRIKDKIQREKYENELIKVEIERKNIEIEKLKKEIELRKLKKQLQQLTTN